MHRLILMRHAEADRLAPGSDGGDHDRPLTSSGQADARRMSQALLERGLRPDLALVSSAERTRQTWSEMEEAFGDVEVRLAPQLYEASPDILRAAVEGAEEEAGCLLLLGHNPGVQLLAAALLTEAAASPAVLDRLTGSFPTSACAVFTIDSAGRPSFEGLLTPRGAA
jgi:phosphohistidine phosphatase